MTQKNTVKKYSFMEDLVDVREKRRLRKCISGVSKSCSGEFMTTSEKRMCPYCSNFIRVTNYTTGIPVQLIEEK